MTYIDLLVLAALAFAVYSGYRRGAILQMFSWGGFVVGILLGGVIAPPIVRAFHPRPGTPRAIIALVSFLGTAFVIEAVVALFGVRVSRKMTAVRIKQADRVVGSVVAGSLLLLSTWLLSAPAQRVAGLAKPVKESAIVRGLDAIFSAPPKNIFASLGALLSHTGFPEVFAGLNPSLAPSVAPPPDSLKNNTHIRAAANLTFKIEGTGCNGRVDGSGFPASRDLVITAAHVVAGTRDTKIYMPHQDRAFDATVVYLDADHDIAVLRAPSLPDNALTVDPDQAPYRTDGAAIGYPGGGPRTISVARVRARTDADGFDIYNNKRVQRSIYVLRALVRQGNSGGPFVDEQGRVRGMVFAASASNKEESYALSETEIERAVAGARGRTQQVDTGDCAI